MSSPPVIASHAASENEADRLARLRELVILDSEPEAVFDALAKMASEACGVPVALISLIDVERQWFKANVGLGGINETPRDVAFCDYAIRTDAVFEVPDTQVDPRFSQNPLVTDAPNIRFYAGAPLILPGGQRVGTLCVMGREARHLTAAQTATLTSLAAIATQTLIMRRDLIEKTLSVRAQQERTVGQSERFIRLIADSLPIRISYIDRSLQYRFVNQAQCDRYGLTRYQILGHLRQELEGNVRSTDIESHMRAVLEGRPQRFEFEEISPAGVRRIEATLTPDVLANGEVVGFFKTGVDITERVATERALREVNAIIQNTSDFVTQIDRHGTLTFMNPAARIVCGIALNAPLTGVTFTRFNPPETLRLHAEVILPALDKHGIWVGETTLYAANRREIRVSHMVIAHRDELGRLERFSAVMRDIADETHAKRDALRQMNTLRSVAEAIPESVAVVGADLRYRFVNSAFERTLATPREQIIGQPMRDVLGRDAFLQHMPWFARALAGETVSFESAVPIENGGTRHLLISHAPLRVDQANVDSVVTVARDISLQKREEMRLREVSQRDPLTGLLNRAGLDQYLERAMAEGHGPSLALLYIDLDHFKQVNDQYGHGVGDEVLKLFAARLQNSVRPTDGVARLGGDEFAVVLCGVSKRSVAPAVADKVIAAAQTPFMVHEVQIKIGASVGIAFAAADAAGCSALLDRADANLYKAKAAGRGRVVDEPDVST